jgi:hypothetical protein
LEARFSFDGLTWTPMPADYSGPVGIFDHRPVNDPAYEDIKLMLENGRSEPLAQALSRKAWPERNDNPKSSLLIGIAAAEVGFKQFVSSLKPDTRWLIQNVPSPPLEKMLREYLPTLTVPGFPTPTVPSRILEWLRKGVMLRNEVAHRDADIGINTLETILISVQDFLWILDYYSGNRWAYRNIRPEVRSAIPTFVALSAETNRWSQRELRLAEAAKAARRDDWGRV